MKVWLELKKRRQIEMGKMKNDDFKKLSKRNIFWFGWIEIDLEIFLYKKPKNVFKTKKNEKK